MAARLVASILSGCVLVVVVLSADVESDSALEVEEEYKDVSSSGLSDNNIENIMAKLQAAKSLLVDRGGNKDLTDRLQGLEDVFSSGFSDYSIENIMGKLKTAKSLLGDRGNKDLTDKLQGLEDQLESLSPGNYEKTIIKKLLSMCVTLSMRKSAGNKSDIKMLKLLSKGKISPLKASEVTSVRRIVACVDTLTYEEMSQASNFANMPSKVEKAAKQPDITQKVKDFDMWDELVALVAASQDNAQEKTEAKRQPPVSSYVGWMAMIPMAAFVAFLVLRFRAVEAAKKDIKAKKVAKRKGRKSD